MIPESIVTIQETNLTVGFMRMHGWEFDVTGSAGNHLFDMVTPFDIDALATDITVSDGQKGDTISIFVGYQIATGLVDNVGGYAAGETVISVDATVAAALRVGRLVNFAADTTDYWVTARDTTNNTITVWPDGATTNTGLVNAISDDDAVLMSIPMLYKSATANSDTRHFGSSKIGGSGIPAGTLAKVVFNNSTATAKTLSIDVEYLYGDEE
jgi:hypothetical protein